jgi:hypothetical protein
MKIGGSAVGRLARFLAAAALVSLPACFSRTAPQTEVDDSQFVEAEVPPAGRMPPTLPKPQQRSQKKLSVHTKSARQAPDTPLSLQPRPEKQQSSQPEAIPPQEDKSAWQPSRSYLPPPPEPFASRWSGVALRVDFIFPERHLITSGTGFIIRDRHGDSYLLTCAHLLRDQEWANRHSVRFHTMPGDRTIETLGSSVHVGTGIKLSEVGPEGRPDMTTDLVIRRVGGNWVKPLRLAYADPNKGDVVWAVGLEPGAPPSDERLFRGRITEVAGGGYTLEKVDSFNPRGFSGGPLVNARGEVVGSILAGGGPNVSGATVGTLRKRLKQNGIAVD